MNWMGKHSRSDVVGYVVLSVAMSGAAWAAAPDPNRAGEVRGPKVVRLIYEKFHDPHDSHHVDANAYRTARVTFITSYEGKRATADSRYRSSISGPGWLHGEARHPWRSMKDRRLIKLLRRSLFERGTAIVRVRARRDGRLDDVRVRIDLSKCSQSPPTYPITCVVKV